MGSIQGEMNEMMPSKNVMRNCIAYALSVIFYIITHFIIGVKRAEVKFFSNKKAAFQREAAVNGFMSC
jgi:hypothetical protein